MAAEVDAFQAWHRARPPDFVPGSDVALVSSEA